MKQLSKLFVMIAIVMLLQGLTLQGALAEPPGFPSPPGTPIGSFGMHLATIAGVLGYGVWKFWKK